MTPLEVRKYNRTQTELEYFWLYCIIVAGRNAEWASAATKRLLARMPEGGAPIQWLAAQGPALRNTLVANRTGQYHRISEAVLQSASVNLRTASVDELEGIYGVGPKTARFFILNSRPDVEHAVLDVHLLRWLAQVCLEDVPRSTPPRGAPYERIESIAIRNIKREFPGVSLADADLLIWACMSNRVEPFI